jgi:hypothetical protein
MKTSTAMNVILKQALFLGMSVVDVMKDVQKNGRMIYSDRVVEAVKVIAND